MRVIQLFSVFARLGLNTKDFDKGIADANEEGKGLASGFGGVGKAVAAEAAVAGAAILGIGTASIRAGMDVDGSMRAIRTQTGMTEDSANEVEGAFRDMALGGVFSASEIAAAYADVAVAGQTAEQGVALMDNAMTLAAATGNDLGNTAYFLGNYLLKVGKDATEADKYVNLFSQAVGNTGMGLNDMQNYMFRMTPAFQQFGASSETNIGIMSRLYQAGIRGANLYSGMGTVMMDFATSGDVAAAATSRFGVAVTDANGNARTNEEIMFDTAHAMREYGDQTAVAQFITENMNQTQQAAWFEFMNLATEIQDEVIPSFDAYSGAAEMAEERAGGLGQMLGAVRNGLTDMKLSLFDVIETPFAGVMQRFIDVIGNLAQKLRPGGRLHRPMQNIARAFASLANAGLRVAENVLPPLISVLGVAGNVLAGVANAVSFLSPLFVPLAAAIVSYRGAMVAANVVKGITASNTMQMFKAHKMNEGSIRAATKATYKQVKAQKAKNVAMKANPIGLVTAAVVGLGAVLYGLASRQNDATRAAQTAREENQRLIDSSREAADAHDTGAGFGEAREWQANTVISCSFTNAHLEEVQEAVAGVQVAQSQHANDTNNPHNVTGLQAPPQTIEVTDFNAANWLPSVRERVTFVRSLDTAANSPVPGRVGSGDFKWTNFPGPMAMGILTMTFTPATTGGSSGGGDVRTLTRAYSAFEPAWLPWQETAQNFVTGTYVGDGLTSAARVVAVGFTPSFVSISLHAALTSGVADLPMMGAGISTAAPNGFLVYNTGNQFSTNTNGVTYRFVAFR